VILLEFLEIKAKFIPLHYMKALWCADIGQIIPNDSNRCEFMVSSTAWSLCFPLMSPSNR